MKASDLKVGMCAYDRHWPTHECVVMDTSITWSCWSAKYILKTRRTNMVAVARRSFGTDEWRPSLVALSNLTADPHYANKAQLRAAKAAQDLAWRKLNAIIQVRKLLDITTRSNLIVGGSTPATIELSVRVVERLLELAGAGDRS